MLKIGGHLGVVGVALRLGWRNVRHEGSCREKVGVLLLI